jgi:hypothetical protein
MRADTGVWRSVIVIGVSGRVVLTLSATAALLAAPSLLAGTAPPPTVTCTMPDDAQQRVYRLEPMGAGGAAAWQLSYRDRQMGSAWLHLRLPGARPEVDGQTMRLAYKNANGGRQVTLTVAPAGSTLEVWVDHGLEVNIEPDLDPRVDSMNTNGPITRIDCRISQ